MDYKAGDVLDLTRVPATTCDGLDVSLVGKFSLEEFCPYEPSNYVYEPCWMITPEGSDGYMKENWYSVSDWRILAHVNPKEYNRLQEAGW